MEDEETTEFNSDEQLFLIRSCLKDGMTPEQANKYIAVLNKRVRNNTKKS